MSFHPIGVVIAVLVIGIGSIVLYKNLTLAIADTYTFSSQDEWESGEFWDGQIDTTSSSGDLKMASGGVGSWSLETPGFPTDMHGSFAYTYEGANYGADLATDGTYIYMILGGLQPELFRYNPELGTWKQLEAAPTSFYYGGAITYYDGFLYAINGNTGDDTADAVAELYRYDIANDSWSRLADAPDNWGLGSDIMSGNNGKIYAVRGRSTDTFWAYNVATDTWIDTLPNVPSPYQIYTTTGHALEYSSTSWGADPVNCEQGCLYAFRGNSNRQFFRYDIQQSQWYSGFADVPTALGNLGRISYGSSMAFDSANGHIYATTGYNNDEFMKYDIASEAWDTGTADTPDFDVTVDEGGSLVYLDSYIYALPGIDRKAFMRFDVDNQKWDSINMPAITSDDYDGDMMVFVPPGAEANCTDASGCLYVARGRSTTTFWRYDISAKTWTTLNTPAAALDRGGGLCYDGNDTIFATRGIAQNSFYSFSIASGSWSTLANVPAVVDEGGGITCLGDDNVYVLAGNNTTGFYHYTGSWATDDTLPVTAFYGGGLSSDGTYVYALAGYYRGNFYKFDPSAGAGSRWSEVASYPTSSYYSTILEFDGDDAIYAFPGMYGTDAFRYDITDDEWNKIADMPARTLRGQAAAHDDTNNIMYVRRGFDTETLYTFSTEPDPYIPSATWISPSIDLTYATSFNSFSATSSTPAGSSLTYYTRTSDDQVSWSSWSQVTGSTINSPADRYIQVKVVMASDGTNAPTLSDFTINYEKDSVTPTNPSASGFVDSTKAEGITTGNSYFHVNPYFEFSGGADSESGLAGYYVQWTDDEADDPDSSEDFFQTESNFVVSTTMEAGTTYYLRVAAKDQAGNTAAPQTLFTYTYNGISPASTKQWTSQAHYEAAGTSETNMNTAADGGTNLVLDSVADGVWTHEAPTPYTMSRDAVTAYDGNDTIFYLESNNQQRLWAYSIANKTYTQKTNYGSAVRYGSAMVFIPNGAQCADASGCLFALAGNSATTFQRYNTTAETWTSLAPISAGVNYGGSLAWNGGNFIYAFSGNNSTAFYRYSISGDSWTPLTSTDQTIRYGGTLAFVPSGQYCADANGCVYATRGNNDNDFYKYEATANAWSYKPNVPIRVSYGASAYYLDGYIYLSRGYAADDFYRYDILNETWENLEDSPSIRYFTGSSNLSYVDSNDSFYLQRGYNEYSLFRYDVSEDKWKTPSIPSGLSTYGFYYGATAFDSTSNTLYVARGYNTPDFYSFDVETETWTERTKVPQRVRPGSDAEFINHSSDDYDGLYMITGEVGLTENVGYFYRYNPETDVWTKLSNAPGELNYGSDLVWDGNDTLYTARGGNLNTFYTYTISTDTWGTHASNVPGIVYRGGCAVRAQDPNDSKWYIYLTRGENQDDLYRFDILDDAWDAAGTLSLAPGNMRYGDACVLDNQGNILIPRGDVANPNEMYVYNIASDSWSTRDVLQYYEYGSLVMTNNNVILGFRGELTSAMERYVVSTSTTGFEANGSWTSEIIDFTQGVYGYGGLTINMTDADDTSVTVETRTCSDAGCAADIDDPNWSEWVQAGNNMEVSGTDYYSIESPVAQYGQLRLSLVSDQLYSPEVHDYTWSYYTDATAPNNPASVDGYTDSGKLTSITSEGWTNDATPYFEWTAADNAGGIGIEGFYVYFGTDNSLDPIDDAADVTNLAYVGGTNYYAVESDGTTGIWNALTQSASALTSDTYYLIIRTSDNNGNTSSSSGTLFTFNLDVDDPVRPASVTASPGSWTSVNDFDFSWPAANDIGGSGIAEYCYEINEGAQTCTSNISVTGLLATQTRENSFCVYSVDNAGNTSTTCREKTFYYAGDAPSAPQNIIVDPVTSVGSPQEDVNQFSFTWDLPSTCLGSAVDSCDGDDILRYCYTINELPSAENCGTNIAGSATPSPDGGWTTTTQTASRSLLSFSAAVQQGLNTMYIVAADAINNIDYDNYTSADFYFSSNAPDVPASAAVTDTSDRATQKYSVVMTWDEPTDVGSGVTGYNVYRCETDCENPDAVDDPPANYTKIATVNTLGYLDTSLDTDITYSYFARAAGTGGVQSGNSAVLDIKPEGKFKFAPLMSGQPSVTAYIRSAIVEWLTLDDQDQYGNIVEHPASSYVEYGETSAYGNEAGTPDLVNEHEVTLTNLQPDTTYHYRTRWQDQDGNTSYSSDYTFETKGAPSAPINGSVTPESNTVNSFTFSWDAPQDEGVTVVGYYYSINNLPNESNVSYTEETSVGPIDAATQQGTNTFYVLAVDDGNNLSYENYAPIEFIANTEPPGSPQAITITDSSDRDAKRYSITITWDPPEGYTLDDEIYYTIKRATADVNASGVAAAAAGEFEEIATITSTGYLDTGLDSSKEYFYQILAKDKAQATSDLTAAVSEIPEGRYTQPPAITEAPAVSPDSFSANITWRTERPASSFIEYGLTNALGEEQGLADLVESHDVKVEGLKPETTYYYRVKSIDVDENIAYSQVASFTTLEAPRVLDVEITDVRLFDATIKWSTNKETTAVIQYGLTTDYGQTLTDVSGGYALDHALKLENLNDGSEYHLRLEGVDRSGNPIESDDYTFVTLTFPEVSDITTENKAEGQTEIYWKTNVPTTSIVEYYADNISPKTQGNTVLTLDHAVLLFGLEDATRYTFNVRGSDEFGYEAVSDDREFVTLEDTTAPEIFGVQSESNTIGSGESSKIQIVVSWKTNEATTSQVEFGVGLGGDNFSDQTDENAELVLDHLTVISDLAPAKTYFFRVVSSDKAGNVTKSGSYTVLTSRKRESFLQLIISNLEQTFSWLGNIDNLF